MTPGLPLLPDFALILLGGAVRRWMPLGDHFWNGVAILFYFILFPALLSNAIVHTRLDLTVALSLLATAFIAMTGGMTPAPVATSTQTVLMMSLGPLDPIGYCLTDPTLALETWIIKWTLTV